MCMNIDRLVFERASEGGREETGREGDRERGRDGERETGRGGERERGDVQKKSVKDIGYGVLE